MTRTHSTSIRTYPYAAALIVAAVLALAFLSTACNAPQAPGGMIVHAPQEVTDYAPLIPPAACVAVGAASDDPIVSNLRDLGYALDYRGGAWHYGAEIVGTAPAEDAPFSLCSTDGALNGAALSERQAIDAAQAPIADCAYLTWPDALEAYGTLDYVGNGPDRPGTVYAVATGQAVGYLWGEDSPADIALSVECAR